MDDIFTLNQNFLVKQILMDFSKHQVIIQAWISKSVETLAFTTVHPTLLIITVTL